MNMVSLVSLHLIEECLLRRRLLTLHLHYLIFADMFFMGVNAASTGGSGGASVFSAASGIGVSLMKADKRRRSSSRALLKKRISVVGTFGS